MAEKTKPKTPYQRVLEEAQDFARKVKCRHTKTMWTYPKDKLNTGWALESLYERVKAAEQLGYEVVLMATDDGLAVRYVKEVPEAPWAFRA